MRALESRLLSDIIPEFPERHRDKPEHFTIIHAR